MVQQGRKSQSPAPPNSKSKGTKRPKCANCQRPGHTIKQCWAEGGGAKGHAPKKRKSRADMKGKGQKETSANVARDNQSPSPPPAIYIMQADEDALISEDPSSSSNFTQLIVDSGASAHMCHNHSYFASYWKLNPPKCIWIAENRTIEACGIGDIEVKTHLAGQTRVGTFKDVLHLPELSEMLISTTNMSNMGINTLFTSQNADLVKACTGNLLACCRWDKNSVSSPPLEPCFDVPNNSPNHLLNSLFLWLEKLAKKSSNQTTHLFSCQNSL